jgi:hypothetical protein
MGSRLTLAGAGVTSGLSTCLADLSALEGLRESRLGFDMSAERRLIRGGVFWRSRLGNGNTTLFTESDKVLYYSVPTSKESQGG